MGTTGPLYLGRDTHALSEPAFVTALEVLAANEVTVLVDSRDGYTPTPSLSLAILMHNDGRASGLADGIVITPSHNPPPDGGFKYNPPDGGPAGAQITSVIQDRANELLATGLRAVRRVRYEQARHAPTTGNSTSWPTTPGSCQPCWTWTRSARPGSGSAPTRWAGPAWPTGPRSPPGSAST